MISNQVPFQTGAVKPFECYRSGWNLIKDQYWLFLGITLVGMLIGGAAPFNILMGPMMCGIYMSILCKARGDSPSFQLLFKGFDHFTQSLIATLIMTVPILLVTLPFYIIMMISAMAQSGHTSDPGIVMALLFVVFFGIILVMSFFIGMLFILTYPLIADRGLTGLEALKTGARAIVANFGGLLGLTLLNVVLSAVGMLCCCVGALLVIPVSMAANTMAFLQVFGDKTDA